MASELSITSVHAHTTRRSIRAIENTSDYQIVYIDTPGIHKPVNALSDRLNDFAYDALSGVDIIVAVFDAKEGIGKGDAFVCERIKNHPCVIAVLNKCESLKNIDLAAIQAQKLNDLLPNANAIIPISAFTNKNVQILKKEILGYLPLGLALFSSGLSHDMTDEFIVGEIMREQLLWRLRAEIPQSLAVIASEVESNNEGQRNLEVKLIVRQKSHKPIIIGKAGSMLEAAGVKAREKIEAFFGCKVYLKSKVIVDENWQDKPESLDKYLF
jgi:GTP-binding protein Era